MLLCGMSFINPIHIQFIFGIEDQLILSYNPDFQHEKRYDANFMSYLLLPVKDYCFLPLHLPVPSMTFLKIAWSSSTDLPFSLAMAT